MSKKLAAKASMIHLPEPVAARPATGSAPDAVLPSTTAPVDAGAAATVEKRPKTAPGSMAVFLAAQSAAVQEAEQLRERVREFDGARPARLLAADRVRASRWSNRHGDSFGDRAFGALKAEIASAGGNVQPICVRRAGEDAGGPFYEIVFGHRRHRACLELGLPVLAVIAEMDDRQLFEAMDRENRNRKNLSPWEQGMTYRRALDAGLYPSQRRMAEALGVDLALVSKSLALAKLPEGVIAAFPSPLDIQYRWAQPLTDAMLRDPDGVVARARKLAELRPSVPAREVLARLVATDGSAVLNGSTPGDGVLIGVPGRRAVVKRDAGGGMTVRLDPGALSADRESQLIQWLRDALT